MQQGIYKFSSSFFFLHNFKLKTEVIIDYKSLLVTELDKFGVIGLLHLHKGILQYHVAECSFQKLMNVYKDMFFLHTRERLVWYIDTKSDDQECVLLF